MGSAEQIRKLREQLKDKQEALEKAEKDKQEALDKAAAAQQELSMADWIKYAVIGVPGFAPGWEINTLANNIDELDTQQFCSIQYCAASSVSSALDLLRRIHKEGNRDTPHTVVAPMGTKPHGIAAAIFLVENSGFQESSLLYDHPLRARGRTTEVRRWHLFRIDLCST